jgi:TRAP-type transport system periplasmic protein
MRASRRTFVAGNTAVFASIGLVKAPAKAAQFEFKCGSDLPADHPSTLRLREMWAAVEQESGGRIHTQIFPSNVLGGPTAMLSQVRLGAVTFLIVAPGNTSSVIPAADIVYLGFAYKDSEEVLRVMDGPVGLYLIEAAAAKGLHGLRTIWDSGMYQITSGSHPIRTPSDLRGFKIRVPESKITVDLFKLFDAIPTPLGANEIYTALQTRLVDGTVAPVVSIETQRFYEVQKYVSMTNHTWSGPWILANGDTWKSLPPDLQDIIERNNTKYALLERADVKVLNASLVDRLTRQGITFNQVNVAPFRAPLRPYFEYWSKAFGPAVWSMLENSLGRKLA